MAKRCQPLSCTKFRGQEVLVWALWKVGGHSAGTTSKPLTFASKLFSTRFDLGSQNNITYLRPL